MAKPKYKATSGGPMLVSDGLQNLVANLGTSRDKASHSVWVDVPFTDDQAVNAYRNSALARKIVDIPAFDACREWREWQGEADQISALEAEEKRLGVVSKVRQAQRLARLFGGSGIVIGDGARDLMEPLNPDRVARGGLRYLAVMSCGQLAAGQLDRDPESEFFNTPRDYILQWEGGSEQLHPSRVVRFLGADLPDPELMAGRSGWGDSVLKAMVNDLRNVDATAANIASLVFEAKVDVIKIAGFMNDLKEHGTAYENAVLKRFALVAQGKGINGALVLDGDDDYDQKSASFATLPDILDRFMQMLSGAADIPMTRLLGQSPAGLNSTGEGDLRNYYDRVRAVQTLEIEPAINRLDECLIRSALGNRPDDIHYNWRSLWQETAKEKAEIGKLHADTASALAMAGLVPDEPLSASVVNALTESGVWPGLEAAMGDYVAADPDDDPEAEAAGTMARTQEEDDK